MSYRYPAIRSKDTGGQVAELRSFLHQLIDQLNYEAAELHQTGEPQHQTDRKPAASEGQSPQATFRSIKALIIKSADIIDAYSDEIQKQLDGHYVAASEFGTFKEETSSKITANSKGVTQSYDEIQKIQGRVESIENQSRRTNAYIRTGWLYEDGAGSHYGVEVGQRSEANGVEHFRAFARFQANRLSFYDANNTEVAYISDYKLHITSASITGALNLGHFWVGELEGDLVFKWTEGN